MLRYFVEVQTNVLADGVGLHQFCFFDVAVVFSLSAFNDSSQVIVQSPFLEVSKLINKTLYAFRLEQINHDKRMRNF